MNSIPVALKVAGVRLPSVISRVWRYINDHPGCTVSKIAAEMNLPKDHISPLVCDLYNRKMIAREFVLTPGKKRNGHSFLRQVSSYRTCIKTYELLPRPVKETTRSSKPTSRPLAPTVVTAVPSVKPKINVDNLTLSEARELYTQLKDYFGA